MCFINEVPYCWGLNLYYQLGIYESTFSVSIPVKVSNISTATQISAGRYHTCAIVNGSAKCWGHNYNGQLGNNDDSSSFVPVQVEGLTSGVTAISAGAGHTCAIVNGSAKFGVIISMVNLVLLIIFLQIV